MPYKQVKTPNFDPYIKQGSAVLKSWLGWCMAYVEQSVGQFYVYGNALVGWGKVKGRHTGQPPVGVWVPLWYSGYYRQGHVLWAKFNANGSGTAYTTPRSHKPYADKITFSSNADLTRQLQRGWAGDIKYLGWSEYVGSRQIVRYVKPAPKPKPASELVVGKRTARKGTATVIHRTGLNVRANVSTKSDIVATYKKGQKFHYDSYVITNGYVWLSYIGGSGKRRYVAEGPYDGKENTVYVTGGIS